MNRQLSDAIEKNVALQQKAAGIDTEGGEARAIASAIKARVDDRSENLKNLDLMIDVTNPSAADLSQLARGISAKGISMNREIQEVAIKKIAGGGNVGAINQLAKDIDLSATSDEFLRTAFVDALRSNSAKPTYFSASLLDQLGQGKPGGFGQSGVEDAMVAALKANKFDAKGILSNDNDTLEILNQIVRTNSAAQDPKILENLEEAVNAIRTNPDLSPTMGNRKDSINNLAAFLRI